MLLAVTAIATILGITPQDVKHFSHTWWYELIINIVAIVVLIGLGAILPSIRRREEKYGIAFNKGQWIAILGIVIVSIIFNLWLGGTHAMARAQCPVASLETINLVLPRLLQPKSPTGWEWAASVTPLTPAFGERTLMHKGCTAYV